LIGSEIEVINLDEFVETNWICPGCGMRNLLWSERDKVLICPSVLSDVDRFMHGACSFSITILEVSKKEKEEEKVALTVKEVEDMIRVDLRKRLTGIKFTDKSALDMMRGGLAKLFEKFTRELGGVSYPLMPTLEALEANAVGGRRRVRMSWDTVALIEGGYLSEEDLIRWKSEEGVHMYLDGGRFFAATEEEFNNRSVKDEQKETPL